MASRIGLIDSLQVLHSARTDEIVVSAMGVAREWMALGSHPLDFVYVPSSMGQAPGLGLGLALARPERRVIVCNGDGSTLMNLGALVTTSAQAPQNYVLIIFDNGVYEVTGAQSTLSSAGARRDERDLDFAAIARACGFKNVLEFDGLESWRQGVNRVLGEVGPTVVVLKVSAIPGAVGPKSPGPAPERAARFRQALRERG